MTETHRGLKCALKLRDLVLLNIVAVFTPGTISQTLPLGRLGLLVWGVGIAAFMLPYVAQIVQAAVATGLIFVNTYGVTLKDGYLALLGSSIVLVMVTYIYLFWSWLRLQAELSARVKLLASLGLAAAAVAIAAGFIPPQTVREVGTFELKIMGSVAFMLVWGLVIYAVGRGSVASERQVATDTR
ncbi:MAG: hypothetical protein ACREEM_41615 [Blastocatellia bacterium]